MCHSIRVTLEFCVFVFIVSVICVRYGLCLCICIDTIHIRVLVPTVLTLPPHKPYEYHIAQKRKAAGRTGGTNSA